MKQAELDELRALLVEQRDQILATIQDMNSKLGTTTKEATGDLSSYSYHMADQGTDAMERELDFMHQSKAGRFLYHIEEAIRRIDAGDYGTCAGCGKSIGITRLRAVPHARLCIACKSAEEDQVGKR